MADIEHKIPKGPRKIDNYWIPGPIRELTLDAHLYMGIIIRFTALQVNQNMDDSLQWESIRFVWRTSDPNNKAFGLIGTRYLALLDSRPYTGINFGFSPIYGNHNKIHNPSREST